VRSRVVRENKCDAVLYKVAEASLDRAIKCLGSQFVEYLEAFREAQSKFTNSSPDCIGKCVKFGEIHRSGKAIARSISGRNSYMS